MRDRPAGSPARYHAGVQTQTESQPAPQPEAPARAQAESVTPGSTGSPTPEAQEAVRQMSAAVLVSLLLIVLVSCVLLLIAMRRRSRGGRARRGSDQPADAWAESARRVGLEDHPDIPREPGTE